jgi:aspartokinase/homoserine dehydrogenase 1
MGAVDTARSVALLGALSLAALPWAVSLLSRELGAAIELADVEIEPFIPLDTPGLDDTTPESFLQTVDVLDDAFAARVAAARAAGQTLRYLAQITRQAGSKHGVTVRVGPVFVEPDHPAASLRGEEAMVAFHTARYAAWPLVVRGAGAGGDVTAAGVLADVLRIAQGVRGR